MRKRVAVWLVVLMALVALTLQDLWAGSRLFVRSNSDKITVAGATSNYGTTNQSYSFWVYPTVAPTFPGEQYQTFYLDWNGAGKVGIVITYEYNGVLWLCRVLSTNGGAQIRYFGWVPTSGTPLPLQTWNHIVITIEPGLANPVTDVKVWLNNVALTQYTNSGGNWNPEAASYGTAYLGVGGGPTEYCNMRMANFVWWSGVLLNPRQITALYRGEPASKVQVNPTRDYPLDGLQSPEPNFGAGRVSGTLTGTSRAPGPPVIPRP